MRSAILHRHWRGVLHHLYANAWHGTATTVVGWEVFAWRHWNRSTVMAVPRDHHTALPPLVNFLRESGLGRGAMVETFPDVHEALEAELEQAGWRVAYSVPGHFIPTGATDLPRCRPEAPPGHVVRQVRTMDQVADFAYVQDQAYREVYDFPRGCAGLFYSHPASLLGPDVIGAVLYDPDGRPVRTAQIVRAGGLVSGIAGAVVPSRRGEHLGECLVHTLRQAARREFGVDVVYHATMPVATPIAVRLGFEAVTTHHRWTAEDGDEAA
jgi:hypothetical protein